MLLQDGTRYWLHVYPDGREERFSAEPADRPSLAVDVKVEGKFLIEQTRTLKKDGRAMPPPGEGWTAHGARRGKLAAWRRHRIACPLPSMLQAGEQYEVIVLADGTEERTPVLSRNALPEWTMDKRNMFRIYVLAADAHMVVEEIITSNLCRHRTGTVEFGGHSFRALQGYEYVPVPPPGKGWRYVPWPEKDRASKWRRVRPHVVLPDAAGENVLAFPERTARKRPVAGAR